MLDGLTYQFEEGRQPSRAVEVKDEEPKKKQAKPANKARKAEEERKAAAQPAPEPEAPTTKICPFCKSEIAIDAVRCPHCTSELPAEE